MTWVKEYSNRAILIEEGQVVIEGEPDEVVEVHRLHTEENKARRAREAKAAGLEPVIAAKGR
jgi:ABC-type polysaccharide/polyol phosphate transport system ATPase subunit